MQASIYTHIDKNKRETVLIVGLFIVFITFLAWVISNLYFGDALFLTSFALIFSGISGFISYYFSDKMVLALSGAHKISKEENPYIFNLVENLCIGAGLPMPKIYVIEDSAMNAFATGRNPDHSVICFTTGILTRLDKLELEGVIAHELAHIGNYDIRLMSVVSVLVGTVSLIADLLLRGVRNVKHRDNGPGFGVFVLIGSILLILSPIIASLIKLAVSRNREYLADSTAALLTRYPDGLASALEKISQDTEILEAANSATAHLYISSPISNPAFGFIGKLFSTHPPIEERIKRLREM